MSQAATYVKSFDHDEVVMKFLIPNMTSANRMALASTRNKRLIDCGYEIGAMRIKNNISLLFKLAHIQY